jgi:hypothetical protein
MLSGLRICGSNSSSLTTLHCEHLCKDCSPQRHLQQAHPILTRVRISLVSLDRALQKAPLPTSIMDLRILYTIQRCPPNWQSRNPLSRLSISLDQVASCSPRLQDSVSTALIYAVEYADGRSHRRPAGAHQLQVWEIGIRRC